MSTATGWVKSRGGGGAGDEVDGVADVCSNVPACAGPAARQQGPGIGHDQPVVVGADHASAGNYPLGDLVRIVYRWQPGMLDDLARRSGVSRRMLLNIEQGNANPGIATLLRISDGLGTGLPGLVDAGRPSPHVVQAAVVKHIPRRSNSWAR